MKAKTLNSVERIHKWNKASIRNGRCFLVPYKIYTEAGSGGETEAGGDGVLKMYSFYEKNGCKKSLQSYMIEKDKF